MDAQVLKPDLWIVVDNSTNPDEDWSIAQGVQYERILEKQSIGWLRNRCIERALEAGADYIVFWDDDDYYPPTRISSGIAALESNPEADIAAASRMYLLLTRENVFLEVGPFGDSHGTAATYTIRRRYVETNRFPDVSRGEERLFTKEWTAKMVQVAAEDTIVVLGHGRNTVDKSVILENPSMYRVKIINSDNGKMFLRSHWTLPWDLLKRTFFA